MTHEEQSEKVQAYEALEEAVRNSTDPAEPSGGVDVRIRYDRDSEVYVAIIEVDGAGCGAEAPTLQFALRALAYLDDCEHVIVDVAGHPICVECRGAGCEYCGERLPHAWPSGGIALPVQPPVSPRRATTYDIAQRVVDEYDSENMGRKVLTVDGDTWRLELSTGGWSSNEEWIEKACTFDTCKQSLWWWWTRSWVSTRRGGHFVFEGTLGDEI